MSEDEENTVLVTVELPASLAKEPSVAAVAQFLEVRQDELDADFGVVSVDPQRGLFAIMLSEDRVVGVSKRLGNRIKGPFSDPEIAPFGPVED